MAPNREPALYIGALSAGLSLLVTLGIGNLTTDQAGGWVALVTAVGGVVTAFVTRPVAVGAFTAVVGAAAALVAAYGYEVAPETIGAINAALIAVIALVARGQVTPVAFLRRAADRRR
jgi:hypothetical protein